MTRLRVRCAGDLFASTGPDLVETTNAKKLSKKTNVLRGGVALSFWIFLCVWKSKKQNACGIGEVFSVGPTSLLPSTRFVFSTLRLFFRTKPSKFARQNFSQNLENGFVQKKKRRMVP